MLKIQPALNFITEPKIKCGEIFCKSFKEITIFCTFCQMKSFQFDDFLLHIQNVHWKYVLQETLPEERRELNDNKNDSYKEEENVLEDIFPKSFVNLKTDVNYKIFPEKDKNVLWENKEWTSINNSESEESWEEQNFKVLNKPRRDGLKKNQQNPERFEAENNSFKDIKQTPNLTKKTKVNGYTCTECKEIFSQKKSLDQHVRDLHNGYKCSLCDKRFSRTSHVECHLKTHTAEKKFICPIENCGRGFIDEEYLKRHLEVHTMEKKFVCEYENCGKAFQTQRRLASHDYTHRIPKKFVCDMCGYSCRSNPQLITHQRVHTGEKPFPCEICRKPFISKTALQEHMITHSETRPHVCTTCNKAFANPRVLVRHSFIHSEEKTFKCKFCETAFKHPNSLQGHMRHVHRVPKLKSTL